MLINTYYTDQLGYVIKERGYVTMDVNVVLFVSCNVIFLLKITYDLTLTAEKLMCHCHSEHCEPYS